jgi:hypothetical protein
VDSARVDGVDRELVGEFIPPFFAFFMLFMMIASAAE